MLQVRHAVGELCESYPVIWIGYQQPCAAKIIRKDYEQEEANN